MNKIFAHSMRRSIFTSLIALLLVLPTMAFAEKAYLEITLKVDAQDVVTALKPLLKADPEIRIYSAP